MVGTRDAEERAVGIESHPGREISVIGQTVQEFLFAPIEHQDLATHSRHASGNRKVLAS
jgi:hypothetical protein